MNYDWGESGNGAFIPNLLGVEAEEKKWAELWVGAHKKAPSKVCGLPLCELYPNIEGLFKILAAWDMLSIQVHPNKNQALSGFEREEKANIELSKRSYKDPNPKPEFTIPITHFWALSGFLLKQKFIESFGAVPELQKEFETEINNLEKANTKNEVFIAKKTIYEKVMRLDQKNINRLLEPIIKKITKQNEQIPFKEPQIEYWVLRANKKYNVNNNYDVGLFSFYMLQLVHLTPISIKNNYTKIVGQALHLEPGNGLFTPAGVPHSYLSGVCAEHMINSDNVVRAGLTPKHKDIDELLKLVDYSETGVLEMVPEVTRSPADIEYCYSYEGIPLKTIFVNQLIDYKKEYTASKDKPCFILVTRGKLEVIWKDKAYSFSKGECVLIPPDVDTCFFINTKDNSSYFYISEN
jgi:mannose-6-phosphate isomerase